MYLSLPNPQLWGVLCIGAKFLCIVVYVCTSVRTLAHMWFFGTTVRMCVFNFWFSCSAGALLLSGCVYRIGFGIMGVFSHSTYVYVCMYRNTYQ